jgi:hypothetical protein
MTFEALVQEITALPIEQRKQLVIAIFDSLTEAPPESISSHSAGEIRAAVEHMQKADTAQETDELRSAWITRR